MKLQSGKLPVSQSAKTEAACESSAEMKMTQEASPTLTEAYNELIVQYLSYHSYLTLTKEYHKLPITLHCKCRITLRCTISAARWTCDQGRRWALRGTWGIVPATSDKRRRRWNRRAPLQHDPGRGHWHEDRVLQAHRSFRWIDDVSRSPEPTGTGNEAALPGEGSQGRHGKAGGMNFDAGAI